MSASHSSSRHPSSNAASWYRNDSALRVSVSSSCAGGRSLRTRSAVSTMMASFRARGTVGARFVVRHKRRIAITSWPGYGVEQVLPAAPERAHLEFVGCDRVAVHPAGDVGPRSVRAVEEASLAAFEARDIVGGAEARGAEEGYEVVHAQPLELRTLVARKKRPCIHFHVARCHGVDRADGAPSGNEQEVRKDQEIASVVRDPRSALLTELVLQASPHFPEFSGGRLHERSRADHRFDNGVTVVERGRTSRSLVAHIQPGASRQAHDGKG